MVLQGLGPQSLSKDFTTSAQWSETSLRCTYCLHIGHFCNHSSETNTLSNLHMAFPFELNQVYFLPTIGSSINILVSMKLLNLPISLDRLSRTLIPFLSPHFLMALKSPQKHQNGSKEAILRAKSSPTKQSFLSRSMQNIHLLPHTCDYI